MRELRKNLVVCPVGPGSLHAGWLADRPSRTFDVFLIHYGDEENFARADADYYHVAQGFKWELLNRVTGEFRDLLTSYERIWMPDADLRADTATINRMFAAFAKHRLQLAQPAISAGEVSFETFRQRPGVVLRYSPFVEGMCPIFTREALVRVAHTFGENRSGWGIDLLWPRHFAGHEVAILDCVGVEHTGQLFRGEHYQKLARLGINPMADFDAVVARHGGFNRRLHRRLVRGRVKLPAIWQPERQVGPLTRTLERWGIWRAVA